VAEAGRRLLLRVEASVAMMRIVLDVPFIVAAGWLAAGASFWNSRLWLAILALMLAHGASNVINDLADLEEDRMTKSWLPLPSGIVDLPQAVATLGLICAGVVGLTAAASPSREAFAVCVGLLALGGVLILAYSLMPGGPLATAVASLPYAILATIGWTLAEGAGQAIVAVLVAVWLYGLACQVHAAVRDVDTDADVGHRSIAVRWGPVRSLVVAAACDVGVNLAALAAAAIVGRFLLVLPLAAAAIAAMLLVYRQVIGRQRSPQLRGRFARVKSTRGLAVVRYGALATLVAAFSIPAAAALAALAALALPLLRRHERRVVGGDLRRRMLA
jgi:4-hydroxybenzoate polyprenyltransferase